MTDLTIDQAIAAVFDEFGVPNISDDEFTARQYCDKCGLPSQSASRHLDDAVRAGKLTRRRVIRNGRRCWGYRLVV